MACRDSDSDEWDEDSTDLEGADEELIDEQDPPPVRILLIAFMCMFQGYGCMVGGPAHALKHKLGISHEQAAEFQDATASFQLAKMLMRV
ncbi:Hypothetical protein (Fragment) [Durusdinium trenchii]|uniref:Uncharacterized protein n=2 Tax=Durusdinium trenchii TaxID=1381693 RepID=A0ABP0P5L4_9DINO